MMCRCAGGSLGARSAGCDARKVVIHIMINDISGMCMFIIIIVITVAVAVTVTVTVTVTIGVMRIITISIIVVNCCYDYYC